MITLVPDFTSYEMISRQILDILVKIYSITKTPQIHL